MERARQACEFPGMDWPGPLPNNRSLECDTRTGSDMMSIIYRPAQRDDRDAGARLLQRVMNELRPRHGLPLMSSPPPIQFPAFCLDRDPEGLWVAEADGSIIGWSFSWRHQTFSFLSQLDVVPKAQGKGVGQALLNSTARWARQREVQDRALITFAFNSHSIGLYVRNGCCAI